MRRSLETFIRPASTAFRSLGLAANIASVRLLRRPLTLYHYCNASLFLRDSLSELRRLPQRYVWDIYPHVHDVQVSFPSVSDLWRWSDPSFAADLMTLVLLCHAVQPNCIFEIGTFKGYTALLFAANSGDEAEVFTLDLPKEAAQNPKNDLTLLDRKLAKQGKFQGPCFVRHHLGPKIRALTGDSATFDFSPYENRVDLFFVDGAHTYEYVKADTASALKCIRPGGVIVWHDYGRSGLSKDVTRWLDELGEHCDLYCSPGSSVVFLPCAQQNLDRAVRWVI